jgi:xanthine dehydrogenase molybdopterin-binding subunit B
VTGPSLPEVLRTYPRLGQWVSIREDGGILVRTGKVELGQGIRTALAQLVAHELGMPIERVEVAVTETGAAPDEGVTSGSRSIEESNGALRQAAADLRAALVARAAALFDVAPASLLLRDGLVVSSDGRSATIPELAEGLATAPVTGTAQLREPVAGSWIGTSVPRLDLAAKVFGQPVFVQDLRFPGMLHGRVCRPPGPGARLAAVDVGAVLAMPGVRMVVRDGSFLAALAEREEQAIRAARRLRRISQWHAAGTRLPDSARFLLEAETTDVIVADDGRPPAPGSVAREISATYSRPYLAHASLGPSCAVATHENGRYHVWSHSQGIYHLRQELAKVLRVEPTAITVTHVEGAGCYGANGADDAALDAALLARAVPGSPVRLQWMRDDEAAWEPFGTAMFVTIRAGLGRDGAIVDWQHDVWGNGHRDRAGADAPENVTNLLAARDLEDVFEPSVPPAPPTRGSGSGRNAVPIYDFGRRRVVNHYVAHTPIRVSALRSLGAQANVFAIESCMDEVAAAIDVDPVEHRLRYLADPRARHVIELAARHAEWANGGRIGDGRGMGMGVARYKNGGAYVAVVAEVELDDEVELRRAWVAVDAGLVINPDGLRNQVEGGLIQAASWALVEQVTFDRARITSRDWGTYPVLRFDRVPSLEVELVERRDEPPVGVGEAVAGPTAGAIGNAVFAASGIRLRDMPFTRRRFEQAAAS